MTVENRTGHDINCEWQLDQNNFECTCGASRPRAAWFVPYADQQAGTNSEAEKIWRVTREIAGG